MRGSGEDGQMPDDKATQDRIRLRQTFDGVAAEYDEARPAYPEQLFDDLVQLAGLHPGAHLLEVGSGTGKATAPLARRGFRITCLELGEQLATVARRNLAGFPDVTVVNVSFDEWQPPPGAVFDLVFAATAWHWLDPDIRYLRAWQLLEPNGHLAFWSATHAFPDDGDTFFDDIQHVYDDIGEGRAGEGTPRPGELPDDHVDIEASGLYDDLQVRQYDWETRHDAESYIALLDTFSGHRDMAPWQRERLFGEIRARLSTRPDPV